MVPRSFLGALSLAAASTPGALLVRAFALPKIFLQVAVRLTLAAAVVTAFVRMKWAIEDKFGRRTAVATTLLLSVTPHFLFYAGRTLPNVFAVYLVTNGIAEWLRMERLPDSNAPLVPFRLTLSILYFVLAVLWFRCDMLVLLGPVALSWLITRKAHFKHLVLVGGLIGTLALATTVLVDSWFWQRWLWPEGVVLFHNTYENGSEKYGVSPPHWYITSALPRAMLAAMLFLPLGLLSVKALPPNRVTGAYPSVWAYIPALCVDWRIAEYALPAFLFIGLYSMLPHKETRFIFPALPLLFLTAGRGLVKAHRAALWMLQGPEMLLPEPRPVAASSWEADLALPGSPAGGSKASPKDAPASRVKPVRTQPAIVEESEEHEEDEAGSEAAGKARSTPKSTPLAGAATADDAQGGELRHRRNASRFESASAPDAAGAGEDGKGNAKAKAKPASLQLNTARQEASSPAAALEGDAQPATPVTPVERIVRSGIRRLSRGVLGELEELGPRVPNAQLPLLQRLIGLGIMGGIVASVLGSAFGTALFVRVSMDNYPGGVALQRLYTLYARDLRRSARVQKVGPELLLWSLESEGAHLGYCPEGDITHGTSFVEWCRQCLGSACPASWPWDLAGGSAGSTHMAAARPCVRSMNDTRLRPIRVHIDVASAESGVSRFGEAWSTGHTWVYSKAEDLTKPEHFLDYDVLITEEPRKHSKAFQVVGREAIPVYSGLAVDWRRMRVHVKTTPKLFIMQRVPDQVVFKPVKKEGTAARS